jgi:hypothetical protein
MPSRKITLTPLDMAERGEIQFGMDVFGVTVRLVETGK